MCFFSEAENLTVKFNIQVFTDMTSCRAIYTLRRSV